MVSSASPEELERLAAIVDEKLTALVPPGKPLGPQSLLLVAMALAHDVETARAKNRELSRGARGALERMLGEVDATLALADRALEARGSND